jgi:signal transduction histidine kinase
MVRAIDRLRNARAADALFALALAAGIVVQLALANEPGLSVAGVAGGLGLTLPLIARHRSPLAVLVGVAAVAVAQEALGGGLYSGQPPLLGSLLAPGIAFYTVGAHETDRRAVAGLATGVIGLWTTVLLTGEPDVQSFLFSGGLVALTPWLAGRAVRARALRFAALERAVVGDERQRIARELHDVMAHGVVLMVLQAQGAQRIFDRDPERARGALTAIEDMGKTALAEMRESLGMLRSEETAAELRPQPRLRDLDELVAEMREAGLKVDVSVEGERRRVGVAVERSAYRIIQEALTNAIRHAGPVPAHVTLTYDDTDLRVEVADEGPGPPAGHRHGHGLTGMRERARLHGGELEARALDGRGFVVRARLPLAP